MMNRHHYWAAAAALLAVSCAGMVVRSEAAAPALASIWQRVRIDVVTELEAAPSPKLAAEIAQADAALASGDDLRVAAVPWADLLTAARSGIARAVALGALHPGVAVSLNERVDQMAQTVAAYVKVPQ